MVATINMLVKEKPKCEETRHCSCCMKVETGSLVFAMLNCIFTGLVSLICTMTIVMNVFWDNYFVYDDAWMKFCITIVMGIIDACFLLAFAFGVVLAKGVFGRKAFNVKIYFVYGVVVAVLSSSAAIAAFYWSIVYEADYITYVSAAIVVCFLYSTILVMVRATYKKFLAENQYQHQMLNERRY